MSEQEGEPQATEDELIAQQMYQQMAYPKAQDVYNVHKFLHDVSVSMDTTKTGNIGEEELGLPAFNVRTLKDVQTYAEMMGLGAYGKYFGAKSEHITATSLSKDGFLDKLSIMTRQQVEALSRSTGKKKNKGWFGKKKQSEELNV